MLLPLLIGLAHGQLAGPEVHLSGYFTLKELSAKLSSRSDKVNVSPDCERDTFVVQCSHASLADVVQALQATGRVTARRGGSGWTLSRPADFAAKSRVLDEYIRQILLPEMKVRADALQIAKRMWSQTSDQRTIEFGELNRQVERKELAYNVVQHVDEALQSENLFPMTVLAELSTKRRFGIGELNVFGIAERPELFFPDAPHLGSWFQKEGPYGPAPESVGVKLSLDPVSGGMTIRTVYGRPSSPYGLAQPRPLSLLRNPTSGPPSPEAVLRPAELAALRKRMSEPANQVSDVNANRTVPIVSSNFRISELLLRVGEASGTDLVEYISPVSDRRLGIKAGYSVASILQLANEGRFDAGFDNRSVVERLAYGGSTSSRTPWWPAFSVKKCGTTLSIRTENDFLDALVEGPPIPAFALSEGKPRASEPTLAAIAKDVAAIRPNLWNGSTFSSWYLDYTNPLAFLPFARALVTSPPLMDAVSKLAPGEMIETAVESIDAPARRELLDGLIQAGPKCDNAPTSKGRDPITFIGVAGHLGQLENDRYVLQIQRADDHIDFRFGNGNVGYWQAWVRAKTTSGGF